MAHNLLLDPNKTYPVTLPDGTEHRLTVYLSNILTHPRIEVGICSYHASFHEIEDYAHALAPYLFPFSPDKLIIGKFCQIAHGVKFITSSANHAYQDGSTYPFDIFDPDLLPEYATSIPSKGDLVIGHDVWIGMNALIMPGVTIGDGAIIGTGAIVTHDVPAYSIWAGNPARQVKYRFDPDVIAQLLSCQWWHWPIELICQHYQAIKDHDLDQLMSVATDIGCH